MSSDEVSLRDRVKEHEELNESAQRVLEVEEPAARALDDADEEVSGKNSPRQIESTSTASNGESE